MNRAAVAARVQAELGVPVLDSVAVTVSASLAAAGAADTAARMLGSS